MSIHFRSKNTERAYKKDWELFKSWCLHESLVPLPAEPETIRRYLRAIAPMYKASSIRRKLAAIAKAHVAAHPGVHNPAHTRTVYDELGRIHAEKHEFPDRKHPITATSLVRALGDWKPESATDYRDRAIVLTCYAGAFKRSQLVAVQVHDIQELGGALVIPVADTNMDGNQLVKVIHPATNPKVCPVAAIRDWLKVSGIKDGPVFRYIDRHGNISDVLSSQSVSLIIKRVAERLGLDPKDLASHSLRAGYTVDLFAAGIKEEVIMKQTGHKREKTLEPYKELAERLKTNLTGAAGL